MTTEGETLEPTPELERAVAGINIRLYELDIEVTVVWMDIRGGDALYMIPNPGIKGGSPESYLMRNMERIQEVIDEHLRKNKVVFRKPPWVSKKIAEAKARMKNKVASLDLSSVVFETVIELLPGNEEKCAVKATHLPSGISVTCGEHWILEENQKGALKKLQERVADDS